MEQKPKMKLWKKILIISISSFIALLILVSIFMDKYKMGIDAYNKKDYEKAYRYLKQIKSDDKNYLDASAKAATSKHLMDSLNLVSSNNDKSEANSNVEAEKTKVSVKEELPPLKTCKSDIGNVKTNGDGSIGSKTEMTELLKLLKNKDCDIIEITFVQKSPPDRNYEDMALKIVYNRVTGLLKSIFTKNNISEDYNNVNQACLMEYLKSGKKNFNSLETYCKDAKYDFNNRDKKQSAIGNKPEQSELDASVKIVEDFIKDKAKDASSIDFLEWSKVSEFGENWIVRCKYKGTNSLGAIVTENVWFYIQNSKVVDTKTIE